MQQFKVSCNRVIPPIVKHFGQVFWRRHDIDDDISEFSCEYADAGFNNEAYFEYTVAKLKRILSLPITFNRKKVELEPEYQEELAFLMCFINGELYRSLENNHYESTYNDLINNYIKLRSFIKLQKLDNPYSILDTDELQLEIKIKGNSDAAIFSNLDDFFDIQGFLQSIKSQIMLSIPRDINLDLNNPNLSRSVIKEIIKRTNNKIELEDHSKYLRACGILLLQQYLKTLPPFNREIPSRDRLYNQSELRLSNDQIRLIYSLYQVMGWEEKGNIEIRTINNFRNRLINYLPRITTQ